jgi:DNA polymerase-3 subunit delta
MAKATSSIPALGYLAHPEKHPVRPVCAVFGDEGFLKLEVLGAIRRQVLHGEDDEFSCRSFVGEEIEDARKIFDELNTVALFGSGQRLIVVNGADPFVSANRVALEAYVAHPSANGILVLELKALAANTRLYKAVAEHGLSIDCGTPKEGEVLKWLKTRAETVHRTVLEPPAAERLLEVIGPQMGRLDQETAKLAHIAGAQATLSGATPPTRPSAGAASGRITIELVDQNVGGWHVRKAWDMVEAAADGNVHEALTLLDRLMTSGEEVFSLLGMLASKLRPLAAAVRVLEDAESEGRKMSPRQAVEQAMTKRWPQAIDAAERQLRQLGRQRAGELYRWLLEADMAVKGARSKGDGPRIVLEELIVRLGRPVAASRSAGRMGE